MKKRNRIDAYFSKMDPNKANASSSSSNPATESTIPIPLTQSPIPTPENQPSKNPRIEFEFDISLLERDPGKRKQMYEYPHNQRDEIRRAYIHLGHYRPILSKYPLSKPPHPRQFQATWYSMFDWLEYSPAKDAIFCFPCFLFNNKPTKKLGPKAFTVDGFKNWKKVNSGVDCRLLAHIGGENSSHAFAVKRCQLLMNQSQHIEKIIEKQSAEQVANNRLRLKTTIDAIKWLVLQACAFRGHDESRGSKNRGNFIELLKLIASYNKEVDSVILENAPRNASYTSHGIQKEILQIFANRTRNSIRQEIGSSKFCILVDEARDVSKKEQMAIVLRFVDKEGFIRERFFDLVHVSDTTSLTLKSAIDGVLSRNNLSLDDIRGQGYDGASNMRGEWNGLQALFCLTCKEAYYVHCLAHRLQLALVGASREVLPIHNFFSKLTFVINIVGGSCKNNDQLINAQMEEIANSLAVGELETGKGLNQIGTLKRAGDTRWGSHLGSIRGLINMYNATCHVLKSAIVDKSSTYQQRGDADSAYDTITSFEFVFILFLMKEIMSTTDDLCQALQRKSQDIVNAMHLVSSTKSLIQKMRDDGWDVLIENVKVFCQKHGIEIPDMNALYKGGRGRPRANQVTVEHHFHFDLFYATIDNQMHELQNRFNDDVVELLKLSSSLDPRDDYSSFDKDKILKLAISYYPNDFSEQEKLHLEYQLKHYEIDIHSLPELKNLLTLSDICQVLVKTRKSIVYPLVDRLLRIVLTLPVSTATTERAFSSMSLVKKKLRNRMGDDFLKNCLITYIEREISQDFDTDSIIDEFYEKSERRAQLKLVNLG